MTSRVGCGVALPTKTRKTKNSGSEPKLEPAPWAAADKLRGHMDAAEYEHVGLGRIFLKYISDAFEEHQKKPREDIANAESELFLNKEKERAAALEDCDEYIAANVFWVPQEARWSHLRANAKQPTIGKTLDDAMVDIERDNPSLPVTPRLIGCSYEPHELERTF
jgi:type I restriction enzyme M protein